MKNKFIIAESERSRILNMHKEATRRNYIIENEEEWVDLSQDIEGESDFSKMEQLTKIPEFNKLVDMLKNKPDVLEDIKSAISEPITEKYKFYDYGDSSGKREITINKYLKRKLINYGIWTTLGAIVGYTMGTMAEHEVLQAALLMAGLGGPLAAELSSNVGRERVKDDEEDSEM